MKKNKLASLIHYIIYRCNANPIDSETLNESLWLSEIIAYRETGKTITNTKYYKQK